MELLFNHLGYLQFTDDQEKCFRVQMKRILRSCFSIMEPSYWLQNRKRGKKPFRESFYSIFKRNLFHFYLNQNVEKNIKIFSLHHFFS